MAAILMQRTLHRCFGQRTRRSFWSSSGFHTVRPTVTHDIMQRCRAKTARTIPLFNKVCKGCHSCLTVEVQDTLQKYPAKTTATLLIFNKACKRYENCLKSRFTTQCDNGAQRQPRLYQSSTQAVKGTTAVKQSMATTKIIYLSTVGLTVSSLLEAENQPRKFCQKPRHKFFDSDRPLYGEDYRGPYHVDLMRCKYSSGSCVF